MKALPDFDVNESWRWLLQEIIIARSAFIIGNPIGPNVSKPVLDLLLPPLLYVRAVSFLDEALASYIDGKGLMIPKQYGTALHGCLSFLNDQGLLPYTSDLKKVKDRRNSIAHRSSKPTTVVVAAATWQELDEAIDIIEGTLQHLGAVGYRPKFEFYWERDAELYPNEPPPDKPNVRLTHHYLYGVKEDNDWVVQYKQSYDFQRVDI